LRIQIGETLMLGEYESAIGALRQEFVEVCKSVFGSYLVAVIAKGSTVKGGFIPGLSDIDLHVYLKNEAFIYSDFLKLDLAFKLQAQMDKLVRRYDFSGSPIQVNLLNESLPPDWSGPLPGTYILLYGEHYPEAEPTVEQMLAQDLRELKNPVYAYKLINSYADKTTDELVNFVRRLQPAVNPTFYRVLSLLTKDPMKVWKLTKFEALEALEDLDDERGERIARLGREFYALASQRKRQREDADFCRAAIRAAYRVIDAGREIGLQLEEAEKVVPVGHLSLTSEK
jgi:predicted nucleotidyltransferase